MKKKTNDYSAMLQTDEPGFPHETMIAEQFDSSLLLSAETKSTQKNKLNRVTSIFAKQKTEYSVLPTDEPVPRHRSLIHVDEQDVPCVEIDELNSGWKHDEFTLHNLSLHVKSKMLIMVTGPVGSGKTNLLMTILREIPIFSGQLSVTGKIAYVSQMPWIFTGTVRENILFGRTFNQVQYHSVLEVCDLNPDISSFPKGDLTMIGQRGVMLSGGQRARVALARAVYSDADIFLLDDPLSAVDAKVGKHLLEKCICEKLVDKIRILVTHQLQHLYQADKVIVLKEGRIVGEGTYEELAKDQNLYHVITDYRDATGTDTRSPIMPLSLYTTTKDELPKIEGIDLAEEDENQDNSSVSWSLYWMYLTSGLRGWLLVCLFVYLLFATGN